MLLRRGIDDPLDIKKALYVFCSLVGSECVCEARPSGQLGQQKAAYSSGLAGLSGFKDHLLRGTSTP